MKGTVNRRRRWDGEEWLCGSRSPPRSPRRATKRHQQAREGEECLLFTKTLTPPAKGVCILLPLGRDGKGVGTGFKVKVSLYGLCCPDLHRQHRWGFFLEAYCGSSL